MHINSAEEVAGDVAGDAQLGFEPVLPIAEDLLEFERLLPTWVNTPSESGKEIINHILGLGGKRVRPALFFYWCKILGYRGDHYYSIAATIEYIHAASLLHDDVVDNSTLRRNKPSANTIWGDVSAVLVGDLIYSRASEMMADTGDNDVVSTFAESIRLMSEGELLQLEKLFRPEMTEKDYFNIVDRKTAALLSASCRAAAILAGESSQVRDQLAQFGRAVGLAFQVIDDSLDYSADEETLGKRTLADLPEGKITLPLIIALKKNASNEKGKFLVEAINQARESREKLSRDLMNSVREIVVDCGAIEDSLKVADQFTSQAIEILNQFQDSPVRNQLQDLVMKLLTRHK